jgi:hypothetical protein
VDELHGLRVCIDTAPIIYFIEKNTKYLNILRPVFVEIDSGNIEAIGASKFLTNDPNLKKVSDIEVLVLDDYLTK